MPDIDTMKTSKYLKKEDVGRGVLVTIKAITSEEPSNQNRFDATVWFIYFNELQKPLWTNVTHREQIADYLGSRNSDHWPGYQVVLFNDQSVINQTGQRVGGIRVKPAQSLQQINQPQQNQATHGRSQNYNQAPEFNDDIPEFNDDIPGFD
jgi:hypothetical protein